MNTAHDQPAQLFRYREQMTRLSVPCPPGDFEPRETIAFRWVFEDMADERNFLPQFFKNPNRFNKMEENTKCQALGLSLFDSAANARSQFFKIQKYMRNDAGNMGSNLARGTIQPDFGLTGLTNEKGHFTFHPYDSVELKEHFEIISSL